MNQRLTAVFVQAALFTAGLFYALSGLAMLAAPQWFYENIGTFPPFNRHYTGDLGSFLLPLGIGLLWAARAPKRHRGIIAVALGGTLIHTANHAYDDWLAGVVSVQTVGLMSFALVLVLAYWVLHASTTRFRAAAPVR